ncbi:MAG: outer membrane protein, partial [Alphaproteobacteria bacterium]
MGYGKEFGGSRVYLGLEFGYFLDGSKGKREYTPAVIGDGELLKTEAKRKDGLELAARMGLIFNQTMPYIKLGWANTKVEATQIVSADTGFAVGPPILNAPQLTQKFLNKRLNGFLVGAGIDMKLNRNLIAGLEYTY